jgi:opacity protein-like surface antigen
MAKTFRLIPVFCLLAAAASSTLAQPVIGGLKIGAPLTDAFSIATGSSSFGSVIANANAYTLGPFVEVRLPLQLSIEADALYRGYNFGTLGATTHASSWDFPIVAKYHFFKGPVKPYVEGGLDFSHLSDVAATFGPNHSTNFGIVLGAGVQLNLLVLRLSPEIRYTGDTLKNFTGPIDSNRNQLAFLVGIGF